MNGCNLVHSLGFIRQRTTFDLGQVQVSRRGGTAEAFGWDVQTGSAAVLGFSLALKTIPPSDQPTLLTTLTLISYNPDDGDLCLEEAIVSDAGGVAYPNSVTGNSPMCTIAGGARKYCWCVILTFSLSYSLCLSEKKEGKKTRIENRVETCVYQS